MPIVIKKRVDFDFLGDDYKDAYLIFQSIPIQDYSELIDSIKQTGGDNTKAALFMLNALKKYFIEGSFPGLETVNKDDLDGLDSQAVIKCFSVFTGTEINVEQEQEVAQVSDLKDASTTPSSTEPTGPTS